MFRRILLAVLIAIGTALGGWIGMKCCKFLDKHFGSKPSSELNKAMDEILKNKPPAKKQTKHLTGGLSIILFAALSGCVDSDRQVWMANPQQATSPIDDQATETTSPEATSSIDEKKLGSVLTKLYSMIIDLRADLDEIQSQANSDGDSNRGVTLAELLRQLLLRLQAAPESAGLKGSDTAQLKELVGLTKHLVSSVNELAVAVKKLCEAIKSEREQLRETEVVEAARGPESSQAAGIVQQASYAQATPSGVRSGAGMNSHGVIVPSAHETHNSSMKPTIFAFSSNQVVFSRYKPNCACVESSHVNVAISIDDGPEFYGSVYFASCRQRWVIVRQRR